MTHKDQRVFKIASIPGDGIGTEITSAARTVLEKLSRSIGTFAFEFETYDWSSENYDKRGYYMPNDGLEQLKKSDAIFFGAVGWPCRSLSLISCTNVYKKASRERENSLTPWHFVIIKSSADWMPRSLKLCRTISLFGASYCPLENM